MANELLRPGVSVIQEFRTVSPTVVKPTLVPCAVGPAFQIIEAQRVDAAGNRIPNTQAIVSAPALINSKNPGPYMGLDGLTLKVSVNNGPAQEFVFSDPTNVGLSAAQVVDQILSATTPPSGFSAYVVSGSYVQLRTIDKGDGQLLKVLDGSANNILGFLTNEVAEGVSAYKQTSVIIDDLFFPDPRGIIDELVIDNSSVRVFINKGSSLQEVHRDQTFLRRKKQCRYPSGALNFPISFAGQKIAFKDDPAGNLLIFTVNGSANSLTELVSLLNTVLGSAYPTHRFEENGTNKVDLVCDTGYLEIGSVTPSINSLLGWTEGAKAYTLVASDDGDGDIKTPYVVISDENFVSPPKSAVVTSSTTFTGPVVVHNKTFRCAVDGGVMQEIVFNGGPIVAENTPPGTNLDTKTMTLVVNGSSKVVTFSGNSLTLDAIVSQINSATEVVVAYALSGKLALQVGGSTPMEGGELYIAAADAGVLTQLGFADETTPKYQDSTASEIVSQINQTMGPGFAHFDPDNKIRLTSPIVGDESKIEIGEGTANSVLGFTAGSVTNGSPYPPVAGDALYADGQLLGYIVQVAPGGVANKLRLDREVTTDFHASSTYIIAHNIPSTLPTDRPTPDLVVGGTAGRLKIKADIIRDTDGVPINTSGALLVAYKALRKDVTAMAKEPALLTLQDVTDLEDVLGPVTPENPLAMQLYYMLVNAAGISVTGLGVDEVSQAYPDGTPDAYARACTFLQSQEVYAIAPTSQDPTIHQILATHVSSMSEPDNKGERVVLICPPMPKEEMPKIVASGTDGDSTATLNEFDTKLASLPVDVLNAGINPSGIIPTSAGLYLTIEGSPKKYNISSVNGTKVTIRTAFAPGENDDEFYATENLPSDLISVTFSVKVRGASLVNSSTKKIDYERAAQAYQDLAHSYSNRRVILVAPEYVYANKDGVEQKVKGYYLCGAIAGMTGRLPPQQGFTNYPITGFTGVSGSNDVFNEHQLNVGAGGGVYWVVQDIPGGPLVCRHQLTTDLTSIETREYSITKIVDFVAKFMRAGLRNFIGKYNVTQSFLDTLSTVIQGQLGFLTEAGVIIGGDLNNIIQDEKAPDTVLVDVTLDIPYPCNYIRLTLVV